MCCWCHRIPGVAARHVLVDATLAQHRLNLPLVSAAMDTVTEAPPRDRDRAGRRHRHRAQEPTRRRQQAAEVSARQALLRSGLLRDPIRMTPQTTRARGAWRLSRAAWLLEAFRCLEGKGRGASSPNRDLRFETRLDAPVERGHDAARAPRLRDAKAPRSTKARRLMHRHSSRTRARRQRRLRAARAHDGQGHHQADRPSRTPARDAPRASLRVGAAVGVGEGTEERVELHSSRPAWTPSSSTPRTARQRRRHRARALGSSATTRRWT